MDDLQLGFTLGNAPVDPTLPREPVEAAAQVVKPEPEPPPPEPPVEPADADIPEVEGPVPAVIDPTHQALTMFDSRPDPGVLSRRSLVDEYVIPPFTMFDTRKDYWQDRKRLWIAMGIESEIGRDEKLTYGKFNQDYRAKTRSQWEAMTPEEKRERGHEVANQGALDVATMERYGAGSTSIFDPVLCEIAYKWMCPAGGLVVDPFGGGSVRGIVAACCGHPYYGIELRDVQVQANRAQAKELLPPGSTLSDGAVITTPLWVQGDSDIVLADPLFPGPADLIFTCPPYGDLEVYSDDPADLSNMGTEEFNETYARILGRAVGHLAEDRFAVIVIGNIRDKKGYIRDLRGLTSRAMEAAGAMPYNEAILLNVSGTGAIRARKQFTASRKLVWVHQTVACYVKGDPKRAAKAIGDRSD